MARWPTTRIGARACTARVVAADARSGLHGHPSRTDQLQRFPGNSGILTDSEVWKAQTTVVYVVSLRLYNDLYL